MSRLRSTTVLSPLIERDPELETLQTAVRAGRGVVVIEAAAGLGKTALLEQAAALAGADGWTVRRAAPSPLEQRLPFGVVRALLEAPAREYPELIDGAALAAGELLRDGVSPRGDSSLLTIAHSTLWFCSALAEEADAPLALVVDDAQWADRMSLSVLAYLARRIDDLPLALFIGTRTSSDLLSLMSGVRAASVLHPRPLSARGAAELVRRVAPETPGTVCRDLQRAAGGVPWLVTELALTEPGEISEPARARVRRRMAELAARERAVIEALAVVGEAASPHVLAEVAGVSVSEVPAARDRLVDAGLLTTDCDHFVHAVIASAVAAELTCGERERLHRAAARALIGAGAEPRAVAGHLLEVGPSANPEVTAWLVAAAEDARGDEAATYLRRALEEGAATDDRPALLAALGVAAFDAGLPEAYATLRAAADEGVRTVDVVARLAGLGTPLDTSAISLDACLADPVTHARRIAALVDGVATSGAAGDAAASPGATTRGPVMPGGTATPAGGSSLSHADVTGAVLLAHRAWVAFVAGNAGAVPLALAALDDPRLLGEADRQRAYELAARVLVVAGHPRADAAVAALCEAASAARTRAAAATLRAELALRQGRLADAEDAARRALAYPDPFCGDAPAVLVAALAERGAFNEANVVLRSFDAIGSLIDGPVETPALREARARLALAEGDYERALDDVPAGPVAALALAHLGRRADAAAVADVALVAAERFGAPLAIAAALHARAVAEPDPALRATICERGLRFAARAADARERTAHAVDAGHRTARAFDAGASTTRGGDADVAVGGVGSAAPPARGEEADTGLRGVGSGEPTARGGDADATSGERTTYGLEAVRLRLELGAALAYLGSRVEARDALRPALADADAAGAVPLSQRARRELVATGLRPRQAALEGAAALTPRQRQICELAAVGKGNRAIAQELFLSIKTVETHLAAGYRKLGVNTRAELAAELAA